MSNKDYETKKYITLDSNKKSKYKSGFQRDTAEGKPRFDLIPTGPLRCLAELYQRGASKYGENNWRLAKNEEEINRFKTSAWRHFVAFSEGQDDEDHGSAVVWNIFAYIWHTKYKNIDKTNK